VLSVTGSSTICVKEKATYTVSGANNYTWSSGPQSNTITVTASTQSPLTFSVKGVAASGSCIATKTLSIVVSKCLDLFSDEQNPSIEIFPNPNSGQFTVISDGNINVMLLTQQGQVVRNFYISATYGSAINVSDLSAGLYYLTDGSGKRMMKVLVMP
jgi:hypothetical protein